MKAYLSRIYHLSASHRLHAESLTNLANQQTFGKCNNPHGHGHNYKVQVTVSGPVDPATGMVVNLADLDAFASQHLLGRFHLANLNTLSEFRTLVPTTENFAVVLHEIFSRFTAATLEIIHVEETSNNSFDLAGTALPTPGKT